MSLYGYVRVSTPDQEQALQAQIDALTSMGVLEANITSEVGSTRKALPGRDGLIEALSPGDELVVFKLDRIGRSRADVFHVFERLDALKVSLRTHDGLLIDPTTAVGRLVRDLLVAIGQFERDNSHERAMEGVRAAKKAGRYRGRSRALRKVDNVTLKALYDAHGASGAAAVLGVTRWTIRREVQRRGLVPSLPEKVL